MRRTRTTRSGPTRLGSWRPSPGSWSAPITGALLAVAAVVGMGAARGLVPLARQLAQARLEAIADGNLSGAVEMLRPIVAQATGSLRAEASDDLGDALDGLGREAAARQAYLAALQADPEDARAARHLIMLGGLSLLGALPTASGPVPPAVTPAADLAAGWEALLPENQRASFEAQIQAFARNRAAQDLLFEGRRLWHVHDVDRSLAIFDELVTQFPAEVKPADLLDIGGRADVQNRPSLAAAAFKTAAQREDPARAPGAYFRLGDALMREDDMKEARVAFGRVIRAGPAARGLDGKLLAIPAEERLRECRGLTSWSAVLAARALFRQGQQDQYRRHDFAAAELAFRRLVDDFPSSNYDGRALVQLAAIAFFERSGDPAALQDLDEVLQNDRKNDLWPDGMRAGAWALFYEGRIREVTGDVPGARAAYRRLLSEFPTNRDHDGKTFASKAQQRLAGLRARP